MDTTLRDGEQTQGVSYTPLEKLHIAKLLLRDLKVDRIEVASARVSSGEFEALTKITDWARHNNLHRKVEVLGFVDGDISLNWINDAGGKVIFMGNHPALVTEKTFREASESEIINWGITEPSGKLIPGVLSYLPAPDVKFDKPCPEIKYLHRKQEDADLYFFFNEGEAIQSSMVTLSGKGNLQHWDAMTGEINKLQKTSSGNEGIRINLAFEPYETKFIVISK